MRNRVPTVRVLGQRRDVGERGSREHNKGIWLFREEEDGWGDLGEELHLAEGGRGPGRAGKGAGKVPSTGRCQAGGQGLAAWALGGQ